MAEDTKPVSKVKQISDVEHPGKSAASATSKPVLVTNRPIIKDPMMKEDSKDGEKIEPKENLAVKGSSKTKIQPLATSPKPEEIKPVEEEKAPKDDWDDEAETDNENQNETQKDKKPKTSVVEDEAAEASRKAEHEANLQKIVDAKTYYLPINAVEKRKTKRFVILGIVLSILLVLIWIDIALDAGLIQIDGITPITHFFST